jgi:hypothetical protein
LYCGPPPPGVRFSLSRAALIVSDAEPDHTWVAAFFKEGRRQKIAELLPPVTADKGCTYAFLM